MHVSDIYRILVAFQRMSDLIDYTIDKWDIYRCDLHQYSRSKLTGFVLIDDAVHTVIVR